MRLGRTGRRMEVREELCKNVKHGRGPSKGRDGSNVKIRGEGRGNEEGENEREHGLKGVKKTN